MVLAGDDPGMTVLSRGDTAKLDHACYGTDHMGPQQNPGEERRRMSF